MYNWFLLSWTDLPANHRDWIAEDDLARTPAGPALIAEWHRSGANAAHRSPTAATEATLTLTTAADDTPPTHADVSPDVANADLDATVTPLISHAAGG